jgi:hypothetical protein
MQFQKTTHVKPSFGVHRLGCKKPDEPQEKFKNASLHGGVNKVANSRALWKTSDPPPGFLIQQLSRTLPAPFRIH